ncbi:unnamed protein product, partial [Brassica napus]
KQYKEEHKSLIIYCKQFLLHGCKSLAQEKRILHQVGETQQQQKEQQHQKRIYLKQRNWELHSRYIVPKSSSSKGIHDLLRSLKDTEKSRNKATASGELVDNQTSQDSLKTSIKVKKKNYNKQARKRNRERTMIDNGYEEKIKHLEKKM